MSMDDIEGTPSPWQNNLKHVPNTSVKLNTNRNKKRSPILKNNRYKGSQRSDKEIEKV